MHAVYMHGNIVDIRYGICYRPLSRNSAFISTEVRTYREPEERVANASSSKKRRSMKFQAQTMSDSRTGSVSRTWGRGGGGAYHVPLTSQHGLPRRSMPSPKSKRPISVTNQTCSFLHPHVFLSATSPLLIAADRLYVGRLHTPLTI